VLGRYKEQLVSHLVWRQRLAAAAGAARAETDQQSRPARARASRGGSAAGDASSHSFTRTVAFSEIDRCSRPPAGGCATASAGNPTCRPPSGPSSCRRRRPWRASPVHDANASLSFPVCRVARAC
jgi:hypothetical protein